MGLLCAQKPRVFQAESLWVKLGPMAKKKKAATRRSGGVVVVQQPSPVRRRRSASVVAAPARSIRRRVSGALGGTHSIKKRITGSAMGGFGVGFIEKTFGDKIPTLPYVGRKGAIALAVYFMEPKSEILRDVGIAAGALAGYELAKDGSISGDDDYDVDGDMLTT
jgi:hypothetical protein